MLIRCDKPHVVASRVFQFEHVVEARLVEDEGLLVRTRDAASFFTEFNRIVIDTGVVVETVAPADESVHAVYDYLIGEGLGGGSA